jgi:chromosome segregation ATPase
MKEKLHFIEGENQQLEQQLQQLEAALAGSRDELAGLKATRDKMRQQGRQLKENSVYVSNPMLLQDMQVMRGAACNQLVVCRICQLSWPSLVRSLQHWTSAVFTAAL